MTNGSGHLAAELLRIGAIVVQPHAPLTWASGLRAPLYCDNRRILGYPRVRDEVAEQFAGMLKQAKWQPEVVAGTATAGIPHATLLARDLDLPLAYVRSTAKAHGKARQVEGASVEGRSVVLIEDLISTGGSVMRAVEALRADGAQEVLGVLAIFSYQLPGAHEQMADNGVPLCTICDFPTMLRVAVDQGYLHGAEKDMLQVWHDDPVSWSARQ